jgi:3-dehydroquinate dehydratase-1
MLRLGQLELDGSVPVLAAGFGLVDPRTIQDARDHGLDVAELRVDLYRTPDQAAVLREVAKFHNMPTIATIRTKAEGGQWERSESERLALFSAVVQKVDAVDVELSAEIRSDVVKLAHSAGRLAVVSFHDFHGTPPVDALLKYVDDATRLGANIVKVATFANSDADVQILARLLIATKKSNLIVIAMGPHGTKSRVFFPALGSLITFASVDQSTAPGQLELDEMVHEIRAYYPKYNERKITQLGLMEAV